MVARSLSLASITSFALLASVISIFFCLRLRPSPSFPPLPSPLPSPLLASSSLLSLAACLVGLLPVPGAS